MGRGDSRLSLKMRRRRAQKSLKQRWANRATAASSRGDSTTRTASGTATSSSRGQRRVGQQLAAHADEVGLAPPDGGVAGVRLDPPHGDHRNVDRPPHHRLHPPLARPRGPPMLPRWWPPPQPQGLPWPIPLPPCWAT